MDSLRGQVMIDYDKPIATALSLHKKAIEQSRKAKELAHTLAIRKIYKLPLDGAVGLTRVEYKTTDSLFTRGAKDGRVEIFHDGKNVKTANLRKHDEKMKEILGGLA